MTKEKKETSSDDLIDALLEQHGISPEGGPRRKRADHTVKETPRRESLDRGTHPSSWLRQREAPEEVDNHRKGYSKKTVVDVLWVSTGFFVGVIDMAVVL